MISHSCEYKAEICNISFWSHCLRISLSVLFINPTKTPFWCGWSWHWSSCCVEVEVKVASVGKSVGREEVDLPQALHRNCIHCCLWYFFFFTPTLLWAGRYCLSVCQSTTVNFIMVLIHCSSVIMASWLTVVEFRLADVLSLELLLCAEGMLKYLWLS